MKKLCLLLVLFVVFLNSQSLESAPLEYVFEGSGSGTLNGVAFLGRNFVIKAYADTDDIVLSYSGSKYVNHVNAYIDIDGLGSYEITTATRTFINNNSKIAGFSRSGSSGSDLIWLGPIDIFESWDLVTPILGITCTGELMQWEDHTGIKTNAGDLVLYDSGTIDLQFTAIPEPCILLMFGAGGLALARRR